MKKILLAATALLTFVSGSAMAADLSRPAPAPVYTKAPMMPVYKLDWSLYRLECRLRSGQLGGGDDHDLRSRGLFCRQQRAGDRRGRSPDHQSQRIHRRWPDRLQLASEQQHGAGPRGRLRVFRPEGLLDLRRHLSLLRADRLYDQPECQDRLVGDLPRAIWLPGHTERADLRHRRWRGHGPERHLRLHRQQFRGSRSASFSSTKLGWTVGAGVEWTWSGWSAKAEYLFVSFPSASVTSNNLTTTVGTFPTNTFTHSADLDASIAGRPQL